MRHFRLPRPQWWLILTALVLQLVLNPCWHSEVDQWVDVLLVALNCAVVVLLVHYVNPGISLRFAVGVALGTPIIILYWIPNTPAILTTIYLLTLLLYLYVIILALPTLLKSEKVNIEQVAASLALYLLIGMAWAIAYYFVEASSPGSFATERGDAVLLEGQLPNFVYFSFVTLTTLGYGDIVPVTCIARSFAILEAICGIACLSFVVARLIGLSTTAAFRKGG